MTKLYVDMHPATENDSELVPVERELGQVVITVTPELKRELLAMQHSCQKNGWYRVSMRWDDESVKWHYADDEDDETLGDAFMVDYGAMHCDGTHVWFTGVLVDDNRSTDANLDTDAIYVRDILSN